MQASSEVASDFQQALSQPDGVAMARALVAVTTRFKKLAPKALPNKETGYVVKSFVRKVLLAMLAVGRARIDWSACSRRDLEAMSCDESGFLAHFDEDPTTQLWMP